MNMTGFKVSDHFCGWKFGRMLALCAQCALLLAAPGVQAASDVLSLPEARAFVERLTEKQGFDRAELSALLAQSVLQEPILNAMNHQAEAKKWFEYRPIFIQQTRVDLGGDFVHQNRDLLTRVEAQYGVPAEVIASIIGVETRWGRFMGNYRVLDALVTLGFYYPRRAEFFQDELEHFFLLSREEELDPLELKGSYAGAMGMGQFIPSSYRNYAVDYDESGHRDLWSSVPDATASVANYLARHGWQPGQPVAVKAEVKGDAWKGLRTSGIQRPTEPVSSFEKHGIVPLTAVDTDLPATFLVLDGKDAPEFWLVLENFYVITRYNRSSMYAMAVYQLSELIAQAAETAKGQGAK